MKASMRVGQKASNWELERELWLVKRMEKMLEIKWPATIMYSLMADLCVRKWFVRYQIQIRWS